MSNEKQLYQVPELKYYFLYSVVLEYQLIANNRDMSFNGNPDVLLTSTPQSVD